MELKWFYVMSTNPSNQFMRSFVWREFLSFERHGDVRMEKSSSLGMPPWNPPGIFKKIQASKLGDAQGIPTLHQQPSGRFVETTFLSLYILCAILGASFYFAFSFVLFVCWSYSCWILSILCGRETRSAFSFEYSFASLISCWVFLATVCLLVSSRF